MISVICTICGLLNIYSVCGIICVAAGFEVVVIIERPYCVEKPRVRLRPMNLATCNIIDPSKAV